MRRPLVLVGFCYLLTLAAAVFLGPGRSRVLFWICLALFAVFASARKTRSVLVFPAAFLTAAVAFGAFAGYSRAMAEPPRALDGVDAEVEGTVCELPDSQYGRWYYVVQLDSVSVPGAPQQFKIRLSSKRGLEVQPYSRIRGKVHFFRPQGGEGYSAASYYESHGIRMLAYLDEFGGGAAVLPPRSKPLYAYAIEVRQAMISSVNSMLPEEEAGLIRGMLLGDKAALPDETVSDFRVAGVSHLLAVSGLHMATIAQLLFLLAGCFRMRRKASALFAGSGIVCFMAVTGFAPSVVRSGVMCLLCLAAPLVSHRADPLNSLGAAVLLLCLPNPYAAADVGLLLSVSATLGLILLAGPIQNRLNARLDRWRPIRPLVRGVNGILATSAAAILFTLPVMILSFGSVSLIAPVSNLLMLVPSTLMIGCSAVGALVGLFAPQSFLLMPFALVGGLFAKYLLACAHLLAQIPYAGVSASYGFVLLWLAGSVLLFAVAFVMHGGQKLAVTAGMLSLAMLLTGVLSYAADSRNVTRIAVMDAGTGLSVAVTRNGRAAMFGCGGSRSSSLIGDLSGENIRRLDALCLLTTSREEAVNSLELAKRFSPAELSAPADCRADGFVERAADCSGSRSWQGHPGFKSLWQEIQVQMLDCGGDEAVRLKERNVTVLILPSDANETLVPREWRFPDFLVTDAPPGSDSRIRPVCTILSMDGQNLRQIPPQTGNHTLWTGGFGNLVLKWEGDRTLSVERES